MIPLGVAIGGFDYCKHFYPYPSHPFFRAVFAIWHFNQKKAAPAIALTNVYAYLNIGQ
jgi:hypothetical protein